nr:MAG TPA: hypothetical protein [Bacteriophage sp.]
MRGEKHNTSHLFVLGKSCKAEHANPLKIRNFGY